MYVLPKSSVTSVTHASQPSNLHVFAPDIWNQVYVPMSHVHVCKPASFGVAASKTKLSSFSHQEFNITLPRKADGGVCSPFGQSDSSCCPPLPLSTSFRRSRYSRFSCPILHLFCQTHCVILEYFGHPQPPPAIFAVSHVRGNYPNRQTRKVNFAALQKFALERAKRSSGSARSSSWRQSTCSLYYTLQYTRSCIPMGHSVDIKK